MLLIVAPEIPALSLKEDRYEVAVRVQLLLASRVSAAAAAALEPLMAPVRDEPFRRVVVIDLQLSAVRLRCARMFFRYQVISACPKSVVVPLAGTGNVGRNILKIYFFTALLLFWCNHIPVVNN